MNEPLDPIRLPRLNRESRGVGVVPPALRQPAFRASTISIL